MNNHWVRATAAWLLVAAAGCSAEVGGGETEETVEESRCAGAGCYAAPVSGAWRQLTSDTTGRVLATAYRDHAPTAQERRLSAVFWLLLVHAERTGELHPLLLNPAFRRRLMELSATYSLMHARGNHADAVRRERHADRAPSSCSEDCRPTVRDVLPAVADIARTLAPTLASVEDRAARLVDDLARWSGNECRAWRVERISSLISNRDARSVLETVGAAVAPARAIRRAAVELGSEVAAPREIAALAGTLGILVTGSALRSELDHLADAAQECHGWQHAHCPTDSGVDVPDDTSDGGTADAGDVPDGDGAVTPPHPVVRVVYIVPSDKTPNLVYAERLTRSIEHVQRFYHSELGLGQTFSLSDPIVEVRESSHSSSYYATSSAGGDPVTSFWYNVVNDGFGLTGGGFNDPNAVWLYYIDADNQCGQMGGGGTSGVAAFPANDLRGLAGESLVSACVGDLPDGYAPPLCRWVGGMAHELGHAFGLPHPPGCDEGTAACDYGSVLYNSLMWMGYSTYPATYLLADDTATLGMSRFFGPADPLAAPFDCNSL